MIEVKSFKDRNGIKVAIDDVIGYFHGIKHIRTGRVVRITKAGYFISVYTEGRSYPWYTPYVERLIFD